MFWQSQETNQDTNTSWKCESVLRLACNASCISFYAVKKLTVPLLTHVLLVLLLLLLEAMCFEGGMPQHFSADR